MKTKLYIKVFIIATIAIIAVISFFPKTQTPYSGTYYSNSTNVELKLNSDNSFDLFVVNDKNSVTINGKYQISNNHIELKPKDKSDSFFVDNISSGIVTGSIISFKKVNNSPAITFTKSE